MAIVDVVMPKLGESIMEATILKWHKKAGDAIASDETLLDIATDKVDSEVPSTASGVVTELLYKENDVVPIGSTIVRIETNGEANDRMSTTTSSIQVEEPEEEIQVPYAPQPKPVLPAASGNINRFYSPLVLTIANSEGIALTELENIGGTGADNRVTKKDILAYLENKKRNSGIEIEGMETEPKFGQNKTDQQLAEQPSLSPQKETETESEPAKNYGGNVEIVAMDRMRKLIAKHMVSSKQTSAHVTSFSEADVTNMVLWRNKIKQDFEKNEGTKITFTPLFIECIIKAIKQYPIINSSVDGDNIVIKKDINIGMATALPNGNLIVPVIRNADYMNLIGLTKSVNTLANNARSGKLKPDDTKDGTFTFTNVGTFGSLMGTPIINQPQVAILAVGIIKKRPVVIETEQGDTLGIRHMMYLSLSYDHRIIDGSIGSSFLSFVAKEIESWDERRTLL
ncbi:MAG: 2-oxo acid dehydrogenase subunit E2 [Bacteroidota bacterium]|nr:2-oxo acid dehydrogenase subunit E2 [Bacteroidota bacterium]